MTWSYQQLRLKELVHLEPNASTVQTNKQITTVQVSGLKMLGFVSV